MTPYYLCSSRIYLPKTTGQRREQRTFRKLRRGGKKKKKKKRKKSRDESLHGGVFSCKECLVEEQKARDPPRSGCKEHSSRQRSPNSFPDGKINVTAAARPHKSGWGKRGVFVWAQVPELKCTRAPRHSTFTPPSNERLAPRISPPNLGPARAINGTRSGPRCRSCVYVFAPRLKSRRTVSTRSKGNVAKREKRKMADDDADYIHRRRKNKACFTLRPALISSDLRRRLVVIGTSCLLSLARPSLPILSICAHFFLSLCFFFFSPAVSLSSCDPRGKVFFALGSAPSGGAQGGRPYHRKYGVLVFCTSPRTPSLLLFYQPISPSAPFGPLDSSPPLKPGLSLNLFFSLRPAQTLASLPSSGDSLFREGAR